MNRRDMIIVAVLMNTGLLAILFMMAIQTDDGSVMIEQPQIQQIVTNTPEPVVLTQTTISDPSTHAVTSPHDELDSVINAYSANMPPMPILIDEDLLHNASKISMPTSPMIPIEASLPSFELPVPPALSVSPVKVEPVKPAVVAAPKKDSVGKVVEVTVKRGDSLDKIARANGSSVKAIKTANNLENDRLKIGQVLKIPAALAKAKTTVAKAETKEKTTTAKAGSIPTDMEYYTIKSGDNPWKIAKKFKVRFEELLQLNSLDEEKARKLKAGDKIRVR